MPTLKRVAQVEIALPGAHPYSGTIDYVEGEEIPTLDSVAIQLHQLVNDLVMSIRKNQVIVDGKEKRT